MQGIVHYAAKDSISVINFNGKLIPLLPVRFDVYDVKQQKNLACRT